MTENWTLQQLMEGYALGAIKVYPADMHSAGIWEVRGAGKTGIIPELLLSSDLQALDLAVDRALAATASPQLMSIDALHAEVEALMKIDEETPGAVARERFLLGWICSVKEGRLAALYLIMRSDSEQPPLVLIRSSEERGDALREIASQRLNAYKAWRQANPKLPISPPDSPLFKV
jgi:hypothetical protein